MCRFPTSELLVVVNIQAEHDGKKFTNHFGSRTDLIATHLNVIVVLLLIGDLALLFYSASA